MPDEDVPPAAETHRPNVEAIPPAPARLTKAEKLEAKAARLREAQAASAQTAMSNNRMLLIASPLVLVIVVLLVLSLVEIHEVSDRNSQIAKLKKSAVSMSGVRAHAAALEQLESLRASAARTAADVSESFGTYDYQTLSTDFARTRAYLTPSFAADFSKLTASLGSLITQDKGQTVGTVAGLGVTSVSATTAVVVVFLDQKVTTAQSSTPRLDHNRLKLTLARQKDGRWLVSKLQLI